MKVVIIVKDGCVQDVLTDAEELVEVEILDLDTDSEVEHDNYQALAEEYKNSLITIA